MSQALTDRPGDPNVWYMWAEYPTLKASKPSQMAYIPIARMIPLDLASPVIGMAGICEPSRRERGAQRGRRGLRSPDIRGSAARPAPRRGPWVRPAAAMSGSGHPGNRVGPGIRCPQSRVQGLASPGPDVTAATVRAARPAENRRAGAPWPARSREDDRRIPW